MRTPPSILLLSALFVAQTLAAQTSDLFPDSWAGIWKGKLEIYTAAGKVQELPMALEILPTDSSGTYHWRIIYGEDRETGLRDYLLKTLNADLGLYLLDEQNSIEIEAYYIGGKLFQQFAVANSLLFCTNELIGEDTLIWEIIVSPRQILRTTGGASEENPEFPEVDVFQLQTCQRALLKKE
jgi:hypothetical protein